VFAISRDDDPLIIQEIRDLYTYVRLLGQHIKLLHTQLEHVETRITELEAHQTQSIRKQASAIDHIRKHLTHPPR
jgi:hypothetical protein